MSSRAAAVTVVLLAAAALAATTTVSLWKAPFVVAATFAGAATFGCLVQVRQEPFAWYGVGVAGTITAVCAAVVVLL